MQLLVRLDQEQSVTLPCASPAPPGSAVLGAVSHCGILSPVTGEKEGRAWHCCPHAAHCGMLSPPPPKFALQIGCKGLNGEGGGWEVCFVPVPGGARLDRHKACWQPLELHVRLAVGKWHGAWWR